MIIRSHYILTALMLLLGVSGCRMSWLRQEPRYVDPALPMTLTSDELVDHLNNQTQGLDGWQSTSTVMWVRFAKLRARLSGVVACQAPNYFRLMADNAFSDADLGSNSERCWMYVRPGDPAVLTWRHEDTQLLQQVPTGMPYIDPNWLMLVLGIKPLDRDTYQISRSPDRDHELWLTAIEDSPAGRPLRRLIKVDAIRGVIREHAVYDSEARLLLQAKLSQYQSRNGHQIPGYVKLAFPESDSEITLTFKNVETNPALPEDLWQLPDRNVQVVDLGRMLRSRFAGHPGFVPDGRPPAARRPEIRLQTPQFGNERSAFGPESGSGQFDGVPVQETTIEEPDWDDPVSFTRTTEPPVFDDGSTADAATSRAAPAWQFWKR